MVSSYKERLYWHIRHIVIDHDDTDDVLQNTFIKSWENFSKFRGDSSLFTWMYRIATNESLQLLRKKKRRSLIPLHDVSHELADKLDTNLHLSGNEIELKLQKAILKLPEQQRLVFNMKYYEDLTFDQISEILKKSTGAMKANYHHARKKLEKYLVMESA